MTTTVQVLWGTVYAPAADYPGSTFTPPDTPPDGFPAADPNDAQRARAMINRTVTPQVFGPGEQCTLSDDDAQRLAAGPRPQVMIVS